MVFSTRPRHGGGPRRSCIGSARLIILLLLGPRLVDDAPGAAARPARPLRGALGARLRPFWFCCVLRLLVALAQSGAGPARRSQAVGAGGGAYRAHFAVRPHARRVGDRLDGGLDIPRSDHQGPARASTWPPLITGGGPLGASVDRGIAYDPCLPACRSRGSFTSSERCGTISSSATTSCDA